MSRARVTCLFVRYHEIIMKQRSIRSGTTFNPIENDYMEYCIWNLDVGDGTWKAEIKKKLAIPYKADYVDRDSHKRITPEEEPQKTHGMKSKDKAELKISLIAGHVQTRVADIPLVRNQTKRVGRRKSWWEGSNHRNVAPCVKKWQSRNTVFPSQSWSWKKDEIAE